jgi:DNA polymerase II small subunit/DNA polymerase delta subunit B
MGIVPTPGKVPIVNLATLDVLVKDFTKSPGDS